MAAIRNEASLIVFGLVLADHGQGRQGGHNHPSRQLVGGINHRGLGHSELRQRMA